MDDATLIRWFTMLAAGSALIGMIWGWFTYKEEDTPDNVVPLHAA